MNLSIKAINFSTYGASFVHLNVHGKVLTLFYNYIKPLPEGVKEMFYEAYGN
ncbi:MAG: hypothetical protein ABI045_04980 [Flavobacteriales bacterium]